MTGSGKVYLIREFAGLDELPPNYRELFEPGEALAIDLGMPWHRNFVATVFPGDEVRFIAAEVAGKPVALLPIRLSGAGSGRVREVVSLTNYYSWLYAPLGASPSPEAFAAMFDWISRRFAPLDAIRLAPLDPTAPSFAALEDGLRQAGWRPFRYFCFGNWHLDAAGNTWSGYLASRAGEMRSTIKRKGKRFAAEGGTLEMVVGGDRVEEAIDAYQTVYAASWKKPEPYPDFIPGLVRTAAAEGWLRLGIARLNGVPIAAQIWLVAHGTANIFKLAYDEKHSVYSSGTLLTALLMQHVMDVDRVTSVDFLCGDDAYKPQWMSARRERWGIVAYNPRSGPGFVGFAREAAGRGLKALGLFERSERAASEVRRNTGSDAPAVVVGCCGHGLSIIRGLSAGNVRVIAVESDNSLPGAHTRLAHVEFVPDINGPALIDALLALRSRIDCRENPVLFLANDRMVRLIGSEWGRLQGRYRLSWDHCRQRVLPLLDKSALEARCAEQGIAYPKTFLLSSVQDVDRAIETIGFPMIVKPARPLSSFKTNLPESAEQLAALVEQFRAELPFIVQNFIPGDDRAIHFTALYLDRGKVLARFDGHKLRSRPLGHTTVAESYPDDAVFEHTLRFFDGLALSGPVSLELKRGPDGRLWVIEPTIGRTDFWVSLCTENGVNLPLLEYMHQTSALLPEARQVNEKVWFNEERDPFGRLWFGRQPGLAMRGRRSAYLFWHLADPSPALFAATRIVRYFGAALRRRIGKVFGG